MITTRELIQRLTRRDLGAWSLCERTTERATLDDTGLRRHDHDTTFGVILHIDTPRGRGSARVEASASATTARELLEHALRLAATTVGPAWVSSPPAAPARVAVLDEALVSRDLDGAAASTFARIRRPADVATHLQLALQRDTTTVVASSGFHATWRASAFAADATLSLGTHQLALTRRARRLDDLDLDAALAAAARDLVQLAAAAEPAPGPCAVWLTPDAFLFDDDLGLWSIFATQADAAFARRGLPRYRLHTPLAANPEPVTIHSDGALDFALRSVPVTDDAVASRRFPLVERGVAIGLGLSPREAALRGTDPNGGIANLIVSPGTWSPPGASAGSPPGASVGSPPGASAGSAAARPGPADAADRLLEVRRLAAVAIDPATAEATLDIAFALDHRPGRPPVPITGGTLRLDLITALCAARRSSQLLRRGAYHGPAHLLLGDAQLLP